MTNRKQTLGRWGEDAAAEYLQARGDVIVARNVRTPHGELDIVARKDDLLLFVEVKTRSSHSFAYPEDSVMRRKQMHMLSAAERYLDLEPDSPEIWQFDVLAIERGPNRETVVTHFENVIG
jgi:putative endonuclease